MSSSYKIKHESEHCTASTPNSLSIYYDDVKKTYTGFCFSCQAKGQPAYVKDPFNGGDPVDPPKKKTDAERLEELQEVRELKAPTFEHRGIPAKYYKRCGVRLEFSQSDGKTPICL